MMSQDSKLTRIDIQRMEKVLRVARTAGRRGEVPVGALIMGPHPGKILGVGWNQKERDANAMAHAEIIALLRAMRRLGSWRLPPGSVLYTNLEPCLMCAGALQQARVSKVIFGALDPKGGGVASLYKVLSDPRLNHQAHVLGNCLAEESSQLLSHFFQDLRKKSKKSGAFISPDLQKNLDVGGKVGQE